MVFHHSEEVRGGAKCMLRNFSRAFPHLCILFTFHFKIFENFVKWNFFKKALFGKSWTWISSCLKESISNWLMLLPLPPVHKHTLVNPKRRIPVLGSHLNIFIWSWNKTNYLLNFNFHWYKFSTMLSKCLQKLMENEANKSMYFCWR